MLVILTPKIRRLLSVHHQRLVCIGMQAVNVHVLLSRTAAIIMHACISSILEYLYVHINMYA